MSDIDAENWQRVSRHLDRVLELPESRWADYLAALGRDDPATAVELERVLHAKEDARFAAFLGHGGPRLPSEPAAAPLSGRLVGPYVIEAEIGRGGMGSVWRARRTDGRFEGHVAIKLLHLSWLGRSGEQRFLLEGRLLARLDHPNVARLIDAGVLEDGQPYLVLEYIEGEPIDVYCDRTGLEFEARIKLFLDVLAAVAHAHRNLIVHRDLKPSNVFVTREGTVKLLDFGIAKLVDTGADAAPTQTLLHGLTPRYAAPEQLLGKPVTTATDVYALAVMLYVLVTGRHPFGRNARAAAEPTDAELMHATIATAAPLASTVAMGPPGRSRALQGDFDNILAKALAKEPTDRYESVGSFADDLRRFLGNEPVLARRPTVGYRAAKFVRRHRGGVVSAVLIALALAGTSIFALAQMLEARSQRDHALAEAQRAQAQQDLTEFVIGDSLSRIPGDLVRNRLDRARAFIARRYSHSPVLAAWLLVDVSGRYIDIGEYRAAAAVTGDVETINARIRDPELTAQLACNRAEDLLGAPDLAGAQAQLATGLESMRQIRYPTPRIAAECADAAALLWQSEGDYESAAARLKEAQRLLVTADMYGTSRYTSTTNNLARALMLAGDYRGAWTVTSGLLTLVRDMGRADTSAWWAMVSVGCRALVGGGQPQRAVAFVDQAVGDARRRSPTFEPPYPLALCRAAARVLSGEAVAADGDLVQAMHRADAGYLAMSTFYPSMTVTAALERADLDTADVRWETLAPLENRAMAAQDHSAEAVRLLLVDARLQLAHGHNDEALRRLQMADHLIAARHQSANPDAYELALLRAQGSMQAGDYANAAKLAASAADLARAAAIDERSSAWVGEALLRRAQAEKATGESASAVTDAREALRHLEPNLLPADSLVMAARGIAAGEVKAN
jgi:eukaryotic-like serine/threonine-protein kinase